MGGKKKSEIYGRYFIFEDLAFVVACIHFFAVNKVCKIGYSTVSVFGVVYGLYVQNRFKSILDNISLTMCRLNISIENKALNIQFI